MKNLNQMQQLIEESLWLVHVVGLWTHKVDSEKQTLRGLMIVDDAR